MKLIKCINSIKLVKRINSIKSRKCISIISKKSHNKNYVNNPNKGYTLLELIVVIAILVTLMGLMSAGVGMISKGNAKKASKIMVSALNELRSNTLSVSGTWSAEVYMNKDGYVAEIKNNAEIKETYHLGSRISISYDGLSLLEGDLLVITYEPRTGKVASVEKNSVDVTNGASGKVTVRSNGSTTENTITLYYLTGKVETDY